MTEVSPVAKPQVTVAGRVLDLKPPTATQAAIIGSTALRMQRLIEKLGGKAELIPLETMLPAIAKVLDVLQALVVNPVDQMWLEDEMIAGRLEYTDLTDSLSAFQEESPKTRRVRRAAN